MLRLQRGMNFLKQKLCQKTQISLHEISPIMFSRFSLSVLKERLNYIADKEHCFSPLNPHLFDVFRLQKSQTKLAPCIGWVLRLLTLLPSLMSSRRRKCQNWRRLQLFFVQSLHPSISAKLSFIISFVSSSFASSASLSALFRASFAFETLPWGKQQSDLLAYH